MRTNDYVYNVLIVCSSDKSKLSLKTMLLDSMYSYNIVYASSAQEARRCISNSGFDLILINSPLTDEFGDTLALDYSNQYNVLFLIKNEMYDNKISDLVKYNVVTIAKPLNKMKFYESLYLLINVVNKTKEANKELVKLKEKLEELRFVSKAKCLLIEKKHLTEEEAHRYIEKEAMDSRVKKKLLSMEIIKKLS